MKQFLFAATIILSAIICQPSFAQTASGYHLAKTFHIASDGKWDYLSVGPNNNRLYVSHGTQVNVLNETTGDSVGVIPNTIGVHGIAFDAALNKGYTSNGKINTVTVFALTTNKVLKQIANGENPDYISFEKFTQKIITSNGKSKSLSVIDPVTDSVIASIPLGGKPETWVSDEAGKIYVNLEDKSEIVEVDIQHNKVLNHWSIAPGEAPTGLAIDVKTNRLFIGSDENKWLIVMDATNGKVVNKQPIGVGCDGVAFDAERKLIFVPTGDDGMFTIVKEKSADQYKVVDHFLLKTHARTIAIDESTHRLFLPTANFESVKDTKVKPAMISGSFQVLVVESGVSCIERSKK